jgi:hypothetical protein
MNDEIRQLQERVEQLERLVGEVHLSDDAIVGADYVARQFGCSPEAVVRGRFGTDRIKRIRRKPLGFRKGDVHKALKQLAQKPVIDDFVLKARVVRRKSIIKK